MSKILQKFPDSYASPSFIKHFRTKLIIRAGSSQNFTVFICLLAPFPIAFSALFTVAAPSAPVCLEHVEHASSRPCSSYTIESHCENWKFCFVYPFQINFLPWWRKSFSFLRGACTIEICFYSVERYQ
jgi:hypothetical protein